MTIIAPLDARVKTPLAIGFDLTEALSRVDGCPTGCGNTEPPRAAMPAQNGWVASYKCADCSHAWTTSWRG